MRAWLLGALLAATLGAIPAVAAGWLSYPPARSAPANAFASVPHSERPAGYWRTAGQALAIAERQPATRALLKRYPGMRVTVFPGVNGQPVAGQWTVRLWPPGSRAGGPVIVGVAGQLVYIADRSGEVLPMSAWAWSRPWTMGTANRTWRARIELFSALLGGVLLLLFWDARRPRSLRNFDLLALLGFGLSFAFFEQGRVLASVPLQYPPLLWFAGRLLWAGLRRRGGAAAPEPAAWASTRVLWMALGVLVAVRVAYNVFLGVTIDVAYASVLGGNAIHHGLPLYWPGSNHLDAYGPAMYLSYLPFELLFPDPGWVWNSLPAAHAAAITFDLLTIGGLLTLGRRLRQNSRLGLVLAVAWAATPWTLQVLDASSNDGLMALLLVGLLLAATSPLVRGSLLGWAVAAKFAPLALAGLYAFGVDRPRRSRAFLLYGAALSLTTAVLIWAFLPPQGLSLFWSKTLGFQLGRHSFMGIWDQYPQLEPLRSLLIAGTAGLAGALLVRPRRRDLYQLAALSGALIVLLELSLRFWSYLYIEWFLPAALVAILAAPGPDAAPAPDPDSRTLAADDGYRAPAWQRSQQQTTAAGAPPAAAPAA